MIVLLLLPFQLFQWTRLDANNFRAHIQYLVIMFSLSLAITLLTLQLTLQKSIERNV